MISFRQFGKWATICALTGLLQACAVSDRRSVGNQIDDNTLDVRVENALEKNKQLEEQANINVFVYNGVVLMTGQAPTQELIDAATQAAQTVEGIKDLQNQVRLGNPVSFTTRTRDSYITSNIKTQLLADKEVSSQNIRVVTENGEVFMLGIVKEAEGTRAIEIARHVNGVAQVVKLFEVKYD
ncbi:MAG TPA: osmotically-inducible protein OsmY [Rheinheimera sp.]|nr:osmotically-inducible protein OsmY [Rheinheimera sp.]